MNYNVKRRLTYSTIAFYFVCGGIEYAVVFPTIWAYLQHLGARNETFLGLAVSAFSMSAILAGPIIGKWFDRTKNAKIVLILANIFEIAGSLMYFVAISPWFVVLSRFVCGIGSGAGAAVLADISHSTSVEERTSILSKLQAMRQVGLMSGPVFNLLLQQFHFRVFDFPVNTMTVPGLFMAFLGIILEAAFILTYFNLGSLKENEKLAESLRHSYDGIESNERNGLLSSPRNTINSEPRPLYEEPVDSMVEYCVEDYGTRRSTMTVGDLKHVIKDVRGQGTDDMIETAENLISNSCNSLREDLSSHVRPPCQVTKETVDDQQWRCSDAADVNEAVAQESKFQVYIDEFLRDEIVVLVGLAFISLFAQTSLETIVTPLSQYLFNFGVFENSMLFLLCGIEILFAFLGVAMLSKKLEDRLILLMGILCLTFSMVWFLIFIPRSTPGDFKSLYFFAIGIFVDLLAIAMILGCSISLYSKLISKERQGLAQGLRRSFACAGTILGPLWGGAVTNRPVILFSVSLVLVVILLILFILSYERLRITDRSSENNFDKINEDHEVEANERTPLLVGARCRNQR